MSEWLIGTRRDHDGQIEVDLGLHALAGLGTGLVPDDLIALLTALICLRDADGESLAGSASRLREELLQRAELVDPRDDCLRSELSLLPDDPTSIAEAADDLIEAAWGCNQAFERAMRASQRLRVGALYERAIVPGLARLAAELSGARERAREGTVIVCDPQAGTGDLLAAVADVVGPDDQPVFHAVEADRYLARLTGRRMNVRGVDRADLKLAVGPDVPDGWASPDVIITQIPYQPGETRSAEKVLDRLDEISLGLAPGCSAAVLGPASVLTGDLRPYSPPERARATLLSSGMIEAVIRLPGGLAPFRPGYELALWVLTSAYESPYSGRVLLADVSDRELTGDVIEALIADVVTWRRDGYQPGAHTRTYGVQVRISDLVDPPRLLTTRRPAHVPSSRTITSGLVTVSPNSKPRWTAQSRTPRRWQNRFAPVSLPPKDRRHRPRRSARWSRRGASSSGPGRACATCSLPRTGITT